jgi:uncharacterized membrane protein YqgA involved in biofilm formation
MTGTIVNAGAVIVGSLIGLLLHKNLPERIVKTFFQAIGLFTIYLGIKFSLEAKEIIILIFSLVFGAITGEVLKLDVYVDNLANRVKKLLKSDNSKFSEGLVTAFIIFCIGPMTFLGALDEGLGKYPEVLFTKSFMDGVSSIALSAGLGIGVAISAIPLFIYQGSITLFAGFLEKHLDPIVINELSATGGILLIGLGISILEIKKIKVVNLLPALVFVVIFMLLKLYFNW